MIKTVSLTAGTETKVEISGGYNVGVINRTTDMLYASRNSGISAGADDVAAIPAGDSYVIRAADDTVYLLATAAGDVQLESIGAKEVFKLAAIRSSSGGGEGGTVDEVARQAIASHANNDEIHLTSEDAIEAAATSISNPNLLINPDFRINQRGKSEYTGTVQYSVDRWRVSSAGKITVNSDGTVTHTSPAETQTWFIYEFDDAYFLDGKTVTLSAETVDGDIISATGIVPVGVVSSVIRIASVPTSIGGTLDLWKRPEGKLLLQFATPASASITPKWAKLELGSVATPFIPPDLATELAKCQRYYQIHTTGDIDPVDIRPSMAEITDIRQREDGNYEYIAEL